MFRHTSSNKNSIAWKNESVRKYSVKLFVMLKRRLLINVLDILVLCCLAVAQPVFSLLGKNVELLAARNSSTIGILLLALTVVLLLPVIFSIPELLARWLLPKAEPFVHRILICILVTLLLLPSMKPIYQLMGNWWICVPLAIAGIASETYVRLRPRGLALAYLSPVVFILPGLFLFHSPVRSIVLAQHSPKTEYSKVNVTTPIVMVVLDEFPLTSLMNDRGEINAFRYPNFAGFAKSATWYRNASSVAASTLHSIPAILEGNLPDPER